MSTLSLHKSLPTRWCTFPSKWEFCHNCDIIMGFTSQQLLEATSRSLNCTLNRTDMCMFCCRDDLITFSRLPTALAWHHRGCTRERTVSLVKTNHLSIRAKYPMGHQSVIETFQNQKLSMISTTVCGYIMAIKGSLWNFSRYKGLTSLLQFSSSLLQFHVNIVKLQKAIHTKKVSLTMVIERLLK